MRTAQVVHHADVVGSMLNPPELIEARTQLRAGALSYEEYRAIEDAAVDRSIRIQEDAGFGIVTDGEHRRDFYFDWLFSGLEKGMEFVEGRPMIQFHDASGEVVHEHLIPVAITEKIQAKDCPGLNEIAYTLAKTDRQVKITLPSPTIMMTSFWDPQHSKRAYPDPFDLGAETRDMIVRWMQQLADVGCTAMQVDCPELVQAWCDPNFARILPGIDQAQFRDIGTELVASLGDAAPDGVTMSMHVCRGNGTQSWMGEGGYEAFSEHVFQKASGYDVFLLEYDDERSGGFEPLRNLAPEKVAVLGLVSTKWTALEDRDALKARIDEAAQYHPKETLGLCTQCGFASASETAADRKVTEQTQVDKLNLIGSVARDVWG